MRNIPGKLSAMKFTSYFLAIRSRWDRAIIREEWILRAVEHPLREVIQKDGRIRRWAQIEEMDGRYLRVILLPNRETIHNAFSTGRSSHENKILSRYGYIAHRVSCVRGGRDQRSG